MYLLLCAIKPILSVKLTWAASSRYCPNSVLVCALEMVEGCSGRNRKKCHGLGGERNSTKTRCRWIFFCVSTKRECFITLFCVSIAMLSANKTLQLERIPRGDCVHVVISVNMSEFFTTSLVYSHHTLLLRCTTSALRLVYTTISACFCRASFCSCRLVCHRRELTILSSVALPGIRTMFRNPPPCAINCCRVTPMP